MRLIQFLITKTKRKKKKTKTKHIISRPSIMQFSAILTGLIKLRLHSFKFLIEANITPVQKKLCRFPDLIRTNIKNKSVVMDPAF